MTRRNIIVEFIGVPGAGKSTIAAALAEELSRRFDVAHPQFIYPRRPIGAMEKLRLDVMYAPHFMMYRIRRLLYDFRRSGPGLWTASNAWERSRYPAFLAEMLARAPKEIYVLDEWVMHRVIEESIARYDSDLAFSTKFAIPTVRTHRLVYVCVRVDTRLALERVMSQDQPFRKFARNKDPSVIDRVLASWDKQIEQLRSEIERRRLPCVDIDGSRSIAANVETLVEWLVTIKERGTNLAPS
jgi:thymidylate kinase